MKRCQPKTVTYRARSYFVGGKTDWHLAHKNQWDRQWYWTKSPKLQATFADHEALINAIASAGGPDKEAHAPGGWLGGRHVIIETITHEEQEFSHWDHSRWQREHPS